MKKTFILILLILTLSITVNSQQRIYTTEKVDASTIKIDGSFDETVWNQVEWSGNFTQYEPNEGEKPSQKTEFKILYDENNIYAAIKVYDTESEKIEKRLSRRDSWDGDLVVVQFDSYYDKKTAFVFAVNAAGVRNDAVTSNDNLHDDDDTWDPLWTVKTAITDYGWSAEMKIPLSQLRFSKKENQVWGLEVGRYIFRKDEWSIWQHIPKETSGWVSRFGELNGLTNLKPKRQIEIAPYFSSKFELYEKEEGNPFADGKDFGFNAGIDGKIGITNDLILDFAVNPDFGQVEADPSEVNLTAFETFFNEKRPFFVEGSNITDYEITPGGSPWSSDNLFYSRRLGSSPHYYPDLADEEYIDMPNNTRILGALKLTGKTKKGLSIGIIESFTNKEYAEIDLNGDRRKEVVEPYTNYFAGRLQKDMNDGNTIFGGMVTSTNRLIDVEYLNFLNTNSYSGGLDFKQFFKDKKYFISTTFVSSYIEGNKDAITEQQLSSRRYYQRPDANYLTYDTTRTSLSGYGGNFLFAKQVSKGLSYMANVTWRSPGIELNDIGYIRRANSIFQYLWAGYRITEPFSIFRSININANQWAGWDYGGTNTFKGGNINAWTQFTNLWTFSFNISAELNNIDNSILRGGPAMKSPGNYNYSFGFGTNSTKKFRVGAHFWNNCGFDESFHNYGIFSNFRYNPFNFLSITLSPVYYYRNTDLQYISTETYENEDQYLFGEILQKTISLTAGVDLNITPDFTIQYYGAPFISAAVYNNFKKITDPKAELYNDRFHVFNNNEIFYLADDESYGINETGNGNYDYFIELPDFNYQQFRSNLVLRWEYKPGSLLYLVWSQDKTDSFINGEFDLGNDLKSMFKIDAYDVFLIKLSYRFIL
ncbi:MAG: carbohydrate binding family 9 domain-containing protein [Bacteroidales bacterium]|nr:carbohydrate binding family 9 domain-containing protein [Bacteroidales bacterium]